MIEQEQKEIKLNTLTLRFREPDPVTGIRKEITLLYPPEQGEKIKALVSPRVFETVEDREGYDPEALKQAQYIGPRPKVPDIYDGLPDDYVR